MLALPQHVGMLFLVTCMFGSRNVDLVVEFCCLHVVVGGFVSHVPWIPGGPTWWANHVLTCHVHVVFPCDQLGTRRSLDCQEVQNMNSFCCACVT